MQEHTLVRVQSQSRHQWKSLTSEQIHKYEQPNSHSLPHTALPCINKYKVWDRDRVWRGRKDCGKKRRKWRECDTSNDGERRRRKGEGVRAIKRARVGERCGAMNALKQETPHVGDTKMLSTAIGWPAAQATNSCRWYAWYAFICHHVNHSILLYPGLSLCFSFTLWLWDQVMGLDIFKTLYLVTGVTYNIYQCLPLSNFSPPSRFEKLHK